MPDDFKHNHIDGPVPGESLTAVPGNAPWQHPPKHTDLDQALQEVWDRMMDPKQCAKLLTMLEAGMPAQAVADVVLFSGFMQGMWTVDLALMMAKPVWAMVAAIGHRAGLNFKLKTKTEDDLDKFLKRMNVVNAGKPTTPSPIKPAQAVREVEPVTQPNGGLMGGK